MTDASTLLPILFVDDEQNILRAITRLFLDEPYELLTAPSGVEGLALLRERPDIGVIVSDQRMPGMSGAEFLEQSRTLVPDAVRIVLTGYADVTAAMDAINKGGAWSGATHFAFRVDATPPLAFTPRVEYAPQLGAPPLVYFETRDPLSGMDHYAVKVLRTDETSGAEEERRCLPSC